MYHGLTLWLPNSLSLLRIVLVFPYFISTNAVLAGLILGTDLLDGAIARKLRITSPLGSVLDTIGDTAFFWGSWIAFFLKGLYGGVWLVLLLLPRIIRFLFVVQGRLRKKHWDTRHWWSDKFGAVAQALGIFWLLFELPNGLLFLGLILAVQYTVMMFEVVKQSRASRADGPR